MIVRLSTQPDRNGRSVVEIDTEKPWAVESTEGVTRFTVLAEFIVEIKNAV